MEKVKTCGACEYADYHMPGARPRGTHVRCEVYSCQKEKESKGCSNWKERKRGKKGVRLLVQLSEGRINELS